MDTLDKSNMWTYYKDMSNPFRGPKRTRDIIRFSTTLDRDVYDLVTRRAMQFHTSRIHFIEIAACLLDAQDDDIIRSLLAYDIPTPPDAA